MRNRGMDAPGSRLACSGKPYSERQRVEAAELDGVVMRWRSVVPRLRLAAPEACAAFLVSVKDQALDL